MFYFFFETAGAQGGPSELVNEALQLHDASSCKSNARSYVAGIKLQYKNNPEKLKRLEKLKMDKYCDCREVRAKKEFANPQVQLHTIGMKNDEIKEQCFMENSNQ
jgi:hypothetical protein